jgi:hypothetical protein
MRRLVLALCFASGLCAWAACTAFSGDNDSSSAARDSGGGESDASLPTMIDGQSAALDASAADAIAVVTFCTTQSGNVLFCDDFELDEAGTQKPNSHECDVDGSAVGIAAGVGRAGTVLKSDLILTGKGNNCDYMFSLSPQKVAAKATLSFDFQATQEMSASYANIGTFVLDYGKVVGVALHGNKTMGIGVSDVPNSNPTIPNDGGWHHAIVTMKADTKDGGVLTFTQTTTIDDVLVGTTPQPEWYLDGGLTSVAVGLGVFFPGFDNTHLIIQIDNVLVKGP